MKNIVSMVAVALFAGVFAVGCANKHDKCTAVTAEKECVDASFVDSLKGKCKWTNGKCENQGGSSSGSGSGSAGSGSGSGSAGTTP